MGLNFRKSINLGKGVKLNVGKKSVGVSAGVKGARVSMNSSGRKTATFSLPGTGLSYSVNLNKLGKKKSTKKSSSSKEQSNETQTSINVNLILVIIILILILVIMGAFYAWFRGII